MSERQPCPACGGAGLVTWAYTMPDGRTHSQDEPCFPCSGTGFAKEIVFRERGVIHQQLVAAVAWDEARDAVIAAARALLEHARCNGGERGGRVFWERYDATQEALERHDRAKAAYYGEEGEA